MTDALEGLQSLLHSRHSCRAFLPDQVKRDTIEGIVADAGRVPSWCNAQPWQLVITSGDETEQFRAVMLDALANSSPQGDFDFPSGYSGEYLKRRRTCGFQLYNAVGVERGDREGYGRQMGENYRLFGAPHVAIITTPEELGTYGAVDCGGFITAFCLAAHARGVATIPQSALAFYAPRVRQHFDIAEDRRILCAISFGYADKDHPANAFRTERAAVSDLVDWRG